MLIFFGTKSELAKNEQEPNHRISTTVNQTFDELLPI